MANKDVRFGCSVGDRYGNRAAVSSYLLVPEAATLTTLTGAFTTWFDAVSAVTDGSTSDGRITVKTADATVTPDGFDDAFLGTTAVINYAVGGKTAPWAIAIPAIIDAARTGDNLNLAQTDVAALSTILIGAVLSGVYTDSDFASGGLTAVRDGFLTDRKRSKHKRKVYA